MSACMITSLGLSETRYPNPSTLSQLLFMLKWSCFPSLYAHIPPKKTSSNSRFWSIVLVLFTIVSKTVLTVFGGLITKTYYSCFLQSVTFMQPPWWMARTQRHGESDIDTMTAPCLCCVFSHTSKARTINNTLTSHPLLTSSWLAQPRPSR